MYFNFGEYKVAQTYRERDSWLNRWLRGEHSIPFECQVYGLELKEVSAFPKPKERQPGMVHVPASH